MQGLVIGLVGAEGDGIRATGQSLIGALAREGYFGLLSTRNGARPIGGESSCRLRAATTAVLNPGGAPDLVLVHNWDAYRSLAGELPIAAGTVLIHEERAGNPPATGPFWEVKPAAAVPAPFEELAEKSSGVQDAKVEIVLGMLSVWLGLSAKRVSGGIASRFPGLGAAALKGKQRAFSLGATYAENNPLPRDLKLDPLAAPAGDRRVADGNEMCARAALFSGCKFFSGHPITPATEAMLYLQREIGSYGGSFLEAEDATAGAAAALGASYAGIKSMTATSGPGFSLQTEVLGLASVAELPLVCLNVQRGGPATGMPTRQEQADLFAAAFSSHGDTVRPILAPTNAADSFDVTVEAFNIAEHYQTPVVVLSDQEIAQTKAIIEPIDPDRFDVVDRLEPTRAELKDYVRFEASESGISPISHPGVKGGNYLAAGFEHDERGTPTLNGEIHARMNRKRLSKLDPLKGRRDLFVSEGDPDAQIGLISWGNVAGIALEAARTALSQGIKVKILVPRLLYPVADEVYADFFKSLRRCVVVEQSHQGQLHKILRMWMSVPREFTSVSKSASNRISPLEIVQLIRAMEQPANDSFKSHYCDLLNVL